MTDEKNASEQNSWQPESPKGQRVLVAMSGGVDSSVTAALLKQQGYDVIGVHMQLWNNGDANMERLGARCCSTIDANDARKVCDRIDIPYYVINSQSAFHEKVVDYFVHEYLQNRTPNPCAMCNNEIKFGYLFQKADELGCKWVATGHYAQVFQDHSSGMARLMKAADPQKDQTYFLFGLTQKALRRTFMPLGGFSKLMVRKMAAEFGLLNAEKADSQEICFIGSEGYKDFIEKRVSPTLRPEGVIRTVDNKVVGQHYGLFRYTIGQRKGLQLTVKDPDQYFVVGFDPKEHALIVGPEEALLSRVMVVDQMNWIRSFGRAEPIKCRVKIRSRHDEAEALVTPFENQEVRVEFFEAQRAITPGQAAVFYDGNDVIGGGFIRSVGENLSEGYGFKESQRQAGMSIRPLTT